MSAPPPPAGPGEPTKMTIARFFGRAACRVWNRHDTASRGGLDALYADADGCAWARCWRCKTLIRAADLDESPRVLVPMMPWTNDLLFFGDGTEIVRLPADAIVPARPPSALTEKQEEPREAG